jgi:catechol 2,3-dioxygenase-like lactoylglutathione lyase family enzyme
MKAMSTEEKVLPMNIEIIGIDHVYIAVSDLRRSEEFYNRVMRILGFHRNTFMNEGDRHIQYYNRHFGLVLRPAHNLHSKHDPLAPGLHHFCFRVEDRAVVDAISTQFAENKVGCSPPRLYPEYAPDYYAIFFTDPDGVRLEVTNYRQERRKRFEDWKHERW